MNLSRQLARVAVPGLAGMATLVCILCFTLVRSVVAQGANEQELSIVLELLSSPDRDTRGLALQQVREGLPGATATRQLAELLPTLSAEGQSALVEGLGERGDATAHEAVLTAAASPVQTVRVSALRALGPLGQASDVSLLLRRAAQGSPLERAAARSSLVRLKGAKPDDALAAALADDSTAVRVETICALTARKAVQAMPSILRSALDPDRAVRVAALRAAESLANAGDTGALIEIAASSREETDRSAAEAALVAVSARGRQNCVVALLKAWTNAEPATRVILLRALAAAGGPEALKTIADACQDRAPSVRDEALRLLSDWPDAAASPFLLKMARQAETEVQQVLALRGLVRLASADEHRAANLELLRELWKLSTGADEKRLVLGALGGSATSESLALAAQGLDDPVVAEEAALAIVLIVEKLDRDAPGSRRALERAYERAKGPGLRQRIEKALK